MQQLLLGVRRPDQSTFANFLAGPNRLLVEELRSLHERARARIVWLWGPAASGKTHLLQAVCNEAGAAGRRAGYFPLDESAGLTPAAIAGWEELDVVCIDNAGRTAGRADWEHALFGLYNAIHEQQRGLLFTALSPPGSLAWKLVDLGSRLSSGLILHLRPLGESEQIAALTLHAKVRGLELPEETSSYLMKRFPRDLRSLCTLLDTLDVASLTAQRRLTVPFIKQVIERRIAAR